MKIRVVSCMNDFLCKHKYLKKPEESARAQKDLCWNGIEVRSKHLKKSGSSKKNCQKSKMAQKRQWKHKRGFRYGITNTIEWTIHRRILWNGLYPRQIRRLQEDQDGPVMKTVRVNKRTREDLSSIKKIWCERWCCWVRYC